VIAMLDAMLEKSSAGSSLMEFPEVGSGDEMLTGSGNLSSS